MPEKLAPVANPRTLATAIKIGAPVSWKKALRAVLRSGGKIITVSEQEIADAKAMIGRDSIGCEPASATTVAGIKKLVAAGHIKHREDVVAVLTGHVLKDPDYMSHYHRGTLSLDSGAKDGSAPQPIRGRIPERSGARGGNEGRDSRESRATTQLRARLAPQESNGLWGVEVARRASAAADCALQSTCDYCDVATQDRFTLMSPARQSSFEVRVPASTANLGAGFDCLGLALEMYLSVRASVLAGTELAHARREAAACAARRSFPGTRIRT